MELVPSLLQRKFVVFKDDDGNGPTIVNNDNVCDEFQYYLLQYVFAVRRLTYMYWTARRTILCYSGITEYCTPE